MAISKYRAWRVAHGSQARGVRSLGSALSAVAQESGAHVAQDSDSHVHALSGNLLHHQVSSLHKRRRASFSCLHMWFHL